MSKSKVFFVDFHCDETTNMLIKLRKLIEKAGMGNIDFENKYVAVKIHFGEYGNLGHIRHQYSKVVCDYIKEKGGKPFLTDASTLYIGSRNNAIDHLDCAYINGYSPLSTGVHTIIADGLRGTDERIIPVDGAKHCPNAKIAAAIAEADILISMTHTKGHMNAGYGGTFKNLGMGCGSRQGKMEMHSSDTPAIMEERCVGCGQCVKHCAHDGISLSKGKALINEDNCVGCGYCFCYCPKGAINCKWDEAKPVMNEKIAEYSKAAIDNKPAFHINFVQQVTEHCDCKPSNDVSMIPDVGVFASFDPVALDQACIDVINSQPIFADSPAGEVAIKQGKVSENGVIKDAGKHDVFAMVHPDTCWEAGINHAVKLGLGSREYELIK